uniref:(California timema) hypothetical protein n=1 Tax=Timema californicum TaxID=61474 RepID=A0A7R9IWF6_TIMCA|nr:unnamed protein product [Timema californicum]
MKLCLMNIALDTASVSSQIKTVLLSTPALTQVCFQSSQNSAAIYTCLDTDEKDLNMSLEDYFLIRFLRPCKFYPHSALERLFNIYNFNYFPTCLTLVVLSSTAEDGEIEVRILVGPMSHHELHQTPRTPLHSRVFPVAEKWKPRACSLDDIFKGGMIVLEGAVLEPRTQVCGSEIIFDLEGLSMKQVMQFSPSFAFNLVHFTQLYAQSLAYHVRKQCDLEYIYSSPMASLVLTDSSQLTSDGQHLECIPLRLKQIHHVNQPYFFNLVFAIFKPFLSEKLRNRLHFHGSDWSSLHSYIDPEFLPTKYGGLMDIPENTGPKLHELLCLFKEAFDVPVKVVSEQPSELISSLDVGARVNHVATRQRLIEGWVITSIQLVHYHFPNRMTPTGTVVGVTVTLVRHAEVQGVGPNGDPSQGSGDGGVVDKELIGHHLKLLVTANTKVWCPHSNDGAVGDVSKPLDDEATASHLREPVVVGSLGPIKGIVLVCQREDSDLVTATV